MPTSPSCLQTRPSISVSPSVDHSSHTTTSETLYTCACTTACYTYTVQPLTDTENGSSLMDTDDSENVFINSQLLVLNLCSCAIYYQEYNNRRVIIEFSAAVFSACAHYYCCCGVQRSLLASSFQKTTQRHSRAQKGDSWN